LQEVARRWKVEAMPTFVLVKDGKEVSRAVAEPAFKFIGFNSIELI
jgi:hypothetical protein